MAQAPAKHERYAADFQAFDERHAANGATWLRRIREHAWDRFSALGFPTARRGNEKWKYTNVAPIANAEFIYDGDRSHERVSASDVRGIVPWRDGWINLVFLDGRYSEALSTSPALANGTQVACLAHAIESNVGVIETHLTRQASVEDDAFTALNTTFLHDGALVHVPEGISLQTPIHLVFISMDGKGATASYPRVLVVADSNSRVTIVESYVSLSEGRHFTDAVAEIVLGEGAEVDHYRLLLEGDDAYHVGTTHVRQAANSTFHSGAFEMGAALGRHDLSVLLDGPGAECHLNGLYVTSGSQHIDNLINIDHAKPDCTSRLYYKGILDGKSRAVFGGTVWVREDAQRTDAHQADKNLVLSPEAEVDSKPALFIYADDVKCGHGATAGNIDQDTVFYMRSRGLDLQTASRLLIYGFAGEIIETVRSGPLKTYLERRFLDQLPDYKFEF